MTTHTEADGGGDAREAAIRRLGQKRALRRQLRQYLLVNLGLIVVWAVTGQGYFWPIWPIATWGLSLLIQAWSITHPARAFSEDEIRREMDQG